ncbi:hypothetical protein D9758_010026 [Tetrapyrgos nigripes]|uniref:Uncharacterized protein n=1 Tax=Tetrapyrgos nigripes TaxID=182062 RepID=A0A8H5CU22_9AGAR|nr:hypothetical protein D9758_010026 [Tetrapyrgos nigripes]
MSPLSLSIAHPHRPWRDRDAARQDFLKSPLFQTFDQTVLDMYVDTALYDDVDTFAGPVVRLKMPLIQEANVFIHAPGSAELLVRLWRGELPDSVALRWIVPAENRNNINFEHTDGLYADL